MEPTQTMRALGLMSGTSMDGIDLALIETDGESLVRPLAFASTGYDEPYRQRLRQAMAAARGLGDRRDRPGIVAAVEREITELHAAAVASMRAEPQFAGPIDVIGFHGQTVLHRPRPAAGETRLTLQLGDGAALARATGIAVVHDLRAADFAAGGEGAPLVPVYHRALAARIGERPLAFLNIGGVANVTLVEGDGRLTACDTGPGNALIDDWVLRHTGARYDSRGALARTGTVDQQVLADLLAHSYFDQPAPKSLDRDAFAVPERIGRSVADGAATLSEFTVRAVARVVDVLPALPRRWIVCGGGRHNQLLMERLAAVVAAPVIASDAIGVDGDATEAEAWAYLAVRSLKGLPITFPGTTGVARSMPGGIHSGRSPAAPAGGIKNGPRGAT